MRSLVSGVLRAVGSAACFGVVGREHYIIFVLLVSFVPVSGIVLNNEEVSWNCEYQETPNTGPRETNGHRSSCCADVFVP